jgi:hypothetical protein
VKILNRLPYATTPTSVTVRGEAVRVKAYQIIVWISVGPPETSEWDPRMPRLPAILDTGNNHNFSIRRGQLVQWAGLAPQSLGPLSATRDRGQRVPLHAAAVWLHANLSGSAEIHTDRPPYRLSFQAGIAIYPDEMNHPRLPLRGLRALTDNELRALIDGRGSHVTVGTAGPWWWPFGWF